MNKEDFLKNLVIRVTKTEDIPVLQALIQRSVLELQKDDYSEIQLKKALKLVYGVDTALVQDGTYFTAVWRNPSLDEDIIVGCGGWSQRRTLYGGDQFAYREDNFLDPSKDAAKIRAFFILPDYARLGIGGKILDCCENAAKEKGFTRLEMGATLTGVPFYSTRGYTKIEDAEAPLDEGYSLPIVRMGKEI
jgi:N-acetylglutamate synthase-like GNAT family acetyltransferase